MRWEYAPAHPGYGIFLVYKHLAIYMKRLRLWVGADSAAVPALRTVLYFLLLGQDSSGKISSLISEDLISRWISSFPSTWRDSRSGELRHRPPYELRAYVNQYICKFFCAFFRRRPPRAGTVVDNFFFLYLIIFDYRTYTTSYCTCVSFMS